MNDCVKQLCKGELPCRSSFAEFWKNKNYDDFLQLKSAARAVADKRFGKSIFLRALVEFGNVCKNDCYYCGIRSSHKIERYQLSVDEIMSAVDIAVKMGIFTVVLQGGENPLYDDVLMEAIKAIKSKHKNCAVTLSAGERKYDVYKQFKEAGADRYLLRHESAVQCRYQKLHPRNMSWQKRMECLTNLKELGFQTGIGFMSGAPYEDENSVYEELKFALQFKPQMLGIGPFIAVKDTPFENEKSGDTMTVLFLYAIARLLLPNVLLPSTTALATLDENNRIAAFDAGANVIMPNFTPLQNRVKYRIYDGKSGVYGEAQENFEKLKESLAKNGYNAALFERGDYKELI